MPELVFFLVSMLALFAFVVWDRKRLNGSKSSPLPRATMEKGFTPSGLIQWQVSLATGAMCGFMAYAEWQTPSIPPFTGRMGWIREFLHVAFGPGAALYVCLVLTGVFLMAALAKRPKRINK